MMQIFLKKKWFLNIFLLINSLDCGSNNWPGASDTQFQAAYFKSLTGDVTSKLNDDDWERG